MKSIRLPVFTTLLFVAALLLLATLPNARASAEDQVNQALVTAKSWISQIDAGQYEQSYLTTCSETHEKVPEDRWIMILKTLRKPWGPVVSRKQLSHVYKPNGIPGLEGECMVITYDSAFQHFTNAQEKVQLLWKDGKWCVAGYQAGSKEDPDNIDTTPLPSATETHTDPHVKPEPQ